MKVELLNACPGLRSPTHWGARKSSERVANTLAMRLSAIGRVIGAGVATVAATARGRIGGGGVRERGLETGGRAAALDVAVSTAWR